MAQLVWGSAGERYYEAGADRGVLYVDGVAVPWNGLTAVKENPTGGEPKPYYLDGIKYLNISAAEEFEATIEAFASPREFDLCDGTASISNGLFITQQPRKAFGFSYRTRIGNDLQGLDLGYKIHIVYNALAAPSSRDNASLTDSPTLNALSWAITTTPPRISSYKPTAHMVIDSRRTPAPLLGRIEGVLYGTSTTSAALPSAVDLVGLFTDYEEIEFLVVEDDGTQHTKDYGIIQGSTAPALSTGQEFIWIDTSGSGPAAMNLVIGD